MDHLIETFAFAGVDYFYDCFVRQDEAAGITGLTAAFRIEDRAVQADALRPCGQHPRRRGGKIGIFPEQEFARQKSLPETNRWPPSPTNCRATCRCRSRASLELVVPWHAEIPD